MGKAVCNRGVRESPEGDIKWRPEEVREQAQGFCGTEDCRQRNRRHKRLRV